MIENLSKHGDKNRFDSAPIGAPTQDSKDERISASPRAQSIPPKDAALIERINQFNGSAIEILRSIACLQINSSNNAAVHSAVGKKVTQLKELYPAEGPVIQAFLTCFRATMLASPPSQERQAAPQQVDESAERDWPESFGLYVKPPELKALQEFSGAQLQVENWLQDMNSGSTEAPARFDKVMARFKTAAVNSIEDPTIAQLSLSCLFDTIAFLGEMDCPGRRSLDPSLKIELVELAKDLCTECLKKHSLSVQGLEKGADISDKQIAAALLVFEFSTTLMHDIPEGIGAVGYKPLLALLDDTRMTNERREAVITRLKIVNSEYNLRAGIQEIAKALRADREQLPSWLTLISDDAVQSYLTAAPNGGGIQSEIRMRHHFYTGYFADLKSRLLKDARLERDSSMSKKTEKQLGGLVTKFCSQKISSFGSSYWVPHGTDLFTECIKRDLLDSARAVLETLRKMETCSLSLGRLREIAESGLVNDFNPKLPAWRPFGNGVPFIIPTAKLDEAIHTTGTTSTSSPSDTTNQNADRPMSQRDFSNVLRYVPLIVLDTAFCCEQFERVQRHAQKNLSDLKWGVGILVREVQRAIDKTKKTLRDSNPQDGSYLPDFSALEQLISLNNNLISDNQPSTSN